MELALRRQILTRTHFAHAGHNASGDPMTTLRTAVFFDRDGVMNVDHGYVGSADRFEFMPGVPQAIKYLNDNGYLVFIVTNQSGIGRGYYTEDDYLALKAHIAAQLAIFGAHIDDERHCPYHPQAKIEAYQADHPWRKPAPGMLLDLMAHWPVDLASSLLIGDQPTDLQAAESAGVRGFLYPGGDMLAFVKQCLGEISAPYAPATSGQY